MLARIMTGYLFVLMAVALLLTGCSSGLQEVAFMDNGKYIVNRSLVNDRVTANQPHAQAVFICERKVSSEQMAEMRKDGNIHSDYADCEPATQYVLSADQPVATLYKGPIEAAIIGGGIGAGLAMSGDTVTQSGGSASVKTSVKQTTVNRGKHGRR